MQIAKHTILKLLLFGAVITITVCGQARSLNGQASEQHLCFSSLPPVSVVNAHSGDFNDLPVTDKSTVEETGHRRFTGRFKPFLKYPASIPDVNIAESIHTLPRAVSAHLLQAVQVVVRPAYYNFLFRYTPF